MLVSPIIKSPQHKTTTTKHVLIMLSMMAMTSKNMVTTAFTTAKAPFVPSSFVSKRALSLPSGALSSHPRITREYLVFDNPQRRFDGFYKTRRFSSASSSPSPPEKLQQNQNEVQDNLIQEEQPKDEKSKTKRKFKPPPPPLPHASSFPPWSYQPRSFFHFEILHQSTKSMARVGRIHTPHGIIDTPGFVAVATNGALKGVDFRDADEENGANQQLVFCNTYHLLLHPGMEVMKEAGGLHRFTRRERPFITDSGGFQVFSLAYGSVKEELESGGELKRSKNPNTYSHNQNIFHTKNNEPPVKVTEQGVTFRSYRDGSKLLLTPESTVQAQKIIAADIIIPLDELPPYHIQKQTLAESVERSHRWEARSLREHLKNVKEQAMYCVVHGGLEYELRKKSVEYLTGLPFDGFAIGGSLGKGREELKGLLDWLMPMFDKDEEEEEEAEEGGEEEEEDVEFKSKRIPRSKKPRHLLGIADEESIRHAVLRGVDTMDSCYPTKLGRHGTLFTRNHGLLRIKRGANAHAHGQPICEECTCKTCQFYDRAYLWHLFKANEPLAVSLATLHNLHYMNDLMGRLRQDILDGKI